MGGDTTLEESNRRDWWRQPLHPSAGELRCGRDRI